MTLVPSVPYRYASPAQYDAIAVWAITTIILDLPAVSFFFPFGMNFADANAIAAAIPGIPLAITRNGETQVR